MRVLVKLSGQAFAGGAAAGFDPVAVGALADDIVAASELAEVAVVVGGGNVLRGGDAERWSIDRVEADNVGMLGTAINAILLRAAITARSSSAPTCCSRRSTASTACTTPIPTALSTRRASTRSRTTK